MLGCPHDFARVFGTADLPNLSISSVFKLVKVSVFFSNSQQSLGERKHTPPCSSEELFSAAKDGGHSGRFRW